jgi:hypothetical protein
MQVPDNCDAAGDGRSGVSTLIERGDVVPNVLKSNIVQSEALIAEPGKIAVEIVSVGVDGTGCGTEFSGKGVEPQLGKPSVGAHAILLVGRSMAQHRLQTSCQNTCSARFCRREVEMPLCLL